MAGLFDMNFGQVMQSTPSRLTGANYYPATEPNVRGVLDLATNVPVAGDVLSGLLAGYDAYQGDYGNAALNAVGMLPFVPSMGAITKRAKNVNGALSKPGTVKTKSFAEYQAANPNLDSNLAYKAWSKEADEVINSMGNTLAEKLKLYGITPTFGGGLSNDGDAFVYNNAIGGKSSYMNVPGYGEVRISDHMRGSGLGNDRTFGDAESAFNAIRDHFVKKQEIDMRIKALREQFGITENGGKENMKRIQEYLSANPQVGQKKDVGFWKGKLGLSPQSGNWGPMKLNYLEIPFK